MTTFHTVLTMLLVMVSALLMMSLLVLFILWRSVQRLSGVLAPSWLGTANSFKNLLFFTVLLAAARVLYSVLWRSSSKATSHTLTPKL